MTETFEVQMIPIEKIRILNPRSRNMRKFGEIVDSISSLGLKKPITVSRRNENGNNDTYDLVCGQGRLEAFERLGQAEVPAIVVSVSKEERLLMSLVENFARRQPSATETVRHILILKERGYSNTQIAKKTNMTVSYVGGIFRLLEKGEERLLQAVNNGDIPITVAMMIASDDDASVQQALSEAYERGELKGKQLLRARQMYEKRRLNGKKLFVGKAAPTAPEASSHAMVRAYNETTKRYQAMINKSRIFETQLVFITKALAQLFQDDKFISLLKREKLETLPKYIAAHIKGDGHGEPGESRI